MVHDNKYKVSMLREPVWFDRIRISTDLCISYLLVILVIILLQIISADFRHWFVLPVALCGGLIGADAVRWLRGRLDLYDPQGIIGAVGFHFFFAAPILHVFWDHWMGYVTPPTDWRPWLGAMAVLNFVGLLVYRYTRALVYRSVKRNRKSPPRRLNENKFLSTLVLCLIVSFFLQLIVYWKFGGIWGYISAYEARENSFSGMGWLFAISESFPMLLSFALAIHFRKNNITSFATLSLISLVILIAAILFGGLRGSRSNTVWTLFWAAGVLHLWVGPLTRKNVFIGLCFLFFFMYLYGFYKAAGLEGIRRAGDPLERAELEERSGRTLESTVLGDLGRADIQAFLLYRLTNAGDYDYAWGRTYLGALSLFIPRSIWPDRPPTKVKEGTELQHGSGTWIPGVMQSSKVYGLGGEAMLNFGWLAVPFSYALLGWLVGWVRGLLYTLDRFDPRRLLIPFFVNLCIVALIGDSDNIVFFLVHRGLIPSLLVLFSARSVRTADGEEAMFDRSVRA